MALTHYKLDKRVMVTPTSSNGILSSLQNYLNLKTYIEDVVEDSDAALTLAGTYTITGTFKINTIAERTAAAGVTVDGVLLKDGGVLMDDGTVTQITSITTGVTINKPAGVITTVSSTLAAGAHAVFTVTNSFAVAASVIICNITNYTGAVDGSAGQPQVYIDNITAGTFDIVLFNSDATQALNGTVSIAFAILG